MQDAIPAPPSPPQVIQVTPGDLSRNPEAVHRAYVEQRSELRDQLSNLEEKRQELGSSVKSEGITAIEKTGLEARIGEIDKRIADVEKQLASADKLVSESAAVPGAIPVEPPRDRSNDGPPEEAFVIGGLFIVVVFLPLSLAFARRIWRRSSAAVIAFPQELADRLNRLDEAVDAVAVEVERIGEGQRFVTRLMSEGGRSLAAGAAQPLEVAARERLRPGLDKER